MGDETQFDIHSYIVDCIWALSLSSITHEEVGQNPIEMNVTRGNKRLFCTENRTCQEIACSRRRDTTKRRPSSDFNSIYFSSI